MLYMYWYIDLANIRISFIKPEVELNSLKNIGFKKTERKYTNDVITLINILCQPEVGF